MKKWMVKCSFVIQADTRPQAWEKARQLSAIKHRELLQIDAISSEPLDEADEWIAINEPIKARG